MFYNIDGIWIRMKILELTNYTSGGCGVGARVLAESELLVREGHEVRIFSSNRVKGSSKGELASAQEERKGVKIQRFPATKLGGESFMKWDFERAALVYKPDVIIAHAYRHPHTKKALELARKLGARIYLVTHAPFDTGATTRSLVASWVVRMYDQWIGRKILPQFTGVIAISNWELPILANLGVPQQRLSYIPNGIPDLFFERKPSKQTNRILYFGRLSPVKDLETLIRAFALLKNKDLVLELAGPGEEAYTLQLENLARTLGISSRVMFSGAVYDLTKKIAKLDSATVYVLPSKREGMPQTLIEAMARKKIVVASATPGAKDLVQNGRNGYLFPIGDYEKLAEVLETALHASSSIGTQAKKSVEQFRWSVIIKKLDSLIRSKTQDAD